MYDIIIIGAGPAGLSMAAEARSSGIPAERVLVMEKGQAHSWSIRKFYPEDKLVEANYKGKPAICNGVLCISDMSKNETLSYLDRTIEEFQLNVQYEEGINSIERQADGGFELISNRGRYKCKVCVIAIGILGKPTKPDYKLPPKLRKRAHFDVTSQEFTGQNMLVVGGGDSASEYAQYLVQCGNQVSLAYRRESFERMTRLNRESLLALEQSAKVSILRSCNIESLSEQDGKPLVHFLEDEHSDRVFDQILYALGGSTPENFLREAGIAFDGKQPVITKGYETSVPGLYLVGDLSPASGSIILAFNTANEAMHDICDSHLGCTLTPKPPPGSQSRNTPVEP